MFRVLFFALKLLVTGLACAWLVYNPGLIHIEWLGYVMDTNIAIVILGLLLVIFLMSSLWHIVSSVVKLPWSIKDYLSKKKRTREVQSLHAALIAWEQSDEHYFQKSIQQIKNHDKNSGLVLYLEALYARLTKNSTTAQHKLRSLCLDPAYTQLGHAALLHQALMDGDHEQAWEIYLHLPKNIVIYPPLLEQVFEAALTLKHFQEATDVIDKLKKHRSLTIDHIRQLKAQVALQKSFNFEQDQHNIEAAFVSAQEAYNLDQAPPTALRLMQLLIQRGEYKKIKNIMRFLWEEMPTDDMMVYIEKIEPNENPLTLYNILKKWSENLPFHSVRSAALAKWAIKANLWGEARLHITSLPDNRTSDALKNKLLGDLEVAEYKNSDGALQYYKDALLLTESSDVHKFIKRG